MTTDHLPPVLRPADPPRRALAELADRFADEVRGDTADVQLSGITLATADLRAGAPGREVEVTVPPGLSVTADASRVHQALLALGTNAVRHGAGPIRLAAKADADGVRIEVSDAGPGIPAAEQEAIFEPFHRASPGTRGSGLGLPLVAAIARALGGGVGVRSAPGSGTTVWLTLPGR